MVFTNDASPVLKMQNYRAYNRGDMFVPSQIVPSPLMVAARATAYVGHNPVHAVPLSYTNVKAQLIGSKGMATPVKAVLPSGN